MRLTFQRGRTLVTGGRIWNVQLWGSQEMSRGQEKQRERERDLSGRQVRGTVLNIFAQTKGSNETELNIGQS